MMRHIRMDHLPYPKLGRTVHTLYWSAINLIPKVSRMPPPRAHMIDVKTSQNPEEGAHIPSWSNELIIIISLRAFLLIIKHACTDQLNSFTHLRALLVLHDCGILAHMTNVTGHYSSDTGTTAQVICLWWH
jgi:hypothetical protein